jgi:ribonucleotide monophosphatase NagD (HAD superfamily)
LILGITGQDMLGQSAENATKQEEKLAESAKKTGSVVRRSLVAFDQLNRLSRGSGGSKKTTAIMGDQVFTDVLFARMMGIRAILVPPIKDKTNRITRLKRHFEKGVLRRYYKHHPDAPDIRLGSPLTKEHVAPKGEEQA